MDTKNLRIRYYDTMGHEPLVVDHDTDIPGRCFTIQVTKGKFTLPGGHDSARRLAKDQVGYVPADLMTVSRRVRNLLVRQGLITDKYSTVEFFIDPDDKSFFYVTVISDTVVDDFCRQHGAELVGKTDRDMPWWALPGKLAAHVEECRMKNEKNDKALQAARQAALEAYYAHQGAEDSAEYRRVWGA